MLSESELARLLVGWKKQQGEEIKGRWCVPIDKSQRVSMYRSLIKTLIEVHFYTREELEGNTYRRIMDASINVNSEKKDKWRMAASADWDDAMEEFFPSKLLVAVAPPSRPKLVVEEPVELSNPIDESFSGGLAAPEETEIDEEFLSALRGSADE